MEIDSLILGRTSPEASGRIFPASGDLRTPLRQGGLPRRGTGGGVLPKASGTDPRKPHPKCRRLVRRTSSRSERTPHSPASDETEGDKRSRGGALSPSSYLPIPRSRALYSAQARSFRASHSFFFAAYFPFSPSGTRASRVQSV